MIVQQLAFNRQDLVPYMSEKTLFYHYDKHYVGYINKVKKLVKNTDLEDKPLDEILEHSKNPMLIKNAHQILNHEFFWKSISPVKDQQIPIDLSIKLIEHFGSIQNFKDVFFNQAMDHAGSGWVWLYEKSKDLYVKVTPDTDTMIGNDPAENPLMVLDIWEHAYYLDYYNDKSTYIKTFLEHLINWDFISKNLTI